MIPTEPGTERTQWRLTAHTCRTLKARMDQDAIRIDTLDALDLAELLDILYLQARDTRYPMNEPLRAAVSACLNEDARLAVQVRGAWLRSLVDVHGFSETDRRVASGWFDLELLA